MDMQGLNNTLDKLAKANEKWWYGQALKKEDDDLILRVVLQYEVTGRRKIQ